MTDIDLTKPEHATPEADLRERRLVMVHAWSLPGPHAVDGTLPVDFVTGSVAAGAQRLVAEAAAGWREKYPTVSVEEAVVHGHPRQVMTRDVLLDRVWGTDYLGDGNLIEVHISALREKLGDQDRKLIRTVRGVGYVLREG